MPVAWELVVSWHGETIRAELLQGPVRVGAGGPSPLDLPLPLEGRAPLLAGDGATLQLLAAPGVAWTVDGQAVAPDAAVPLQEGTARLAVGNVEVAVQPTSPPPRFPRFAPLGDRLLGAAAFTAAYALVGLGLYTETPAPCGCLDFFDSIRDARATHDEPPGPPTFLSPERPPSWMAEQPPAPSRDPVTSARGPAAPGRGPRRGGRRPPLRAVELLDAPQFSLRVAELARGDVQDEIVRVEDLDGAPPAASGAALAAGDAGDHASAAGSGRGRGRGDDAGGGLGSCNGASFAVLVARYGRSAAVVACSTRVELGAPVTPGRGHDVVLHERAGSRLAPEVWSWGEQAR